MVRGQGHSDLKMVYDIPPSQDAIYTQILGFSKNIEDMHKA